MRPFLLIGIVLLAPAAQAETLHLVCIGGGIANKVTHRSVYAQNRNGGAWANVTGERAEEFDEQAYVDIEGSSGKIQMPAVMLPPIHGGKNGWMEIEKLAVSDREITGSVGVNFMNSPRLRVDRVTGQLTLSGKAGDFIAQCRAYDPDKVKRAF